MKAIKFSLLFFTLIISGLISAQEADFYTKLSNAAILITKDRVIYDPAYVRIPYPNGDVLADRGVCTDVIVRAYRKLGIDLQEKVHVDMKANFDKYPSKKKWGLKSTDTNIDHRRVPNLETFFTRKGIVKPITNNANDYQAGDVVSWTLDNGLAHIGIVIDKKSKDLKRPLVVHNIGRGQVQEDCLFSWKIVGHYRYK